jgi:hypothetical protein
MKDEQTAAQISLQPGITRRKFLGASMATGASVLAGGLLVTLQQRVLAANGSAPGSTFILGGDLSVHRLGFGAMRLTGEGVWGWPPDRENAKKVLRRAVELGVTLSTQPTLMVPKSTSYLLPTRFIRIRLALLSRLKVGKPGLALISGCRMAAPNTSLNASRRVLSDLSWNELIFTSYIASIAMCQSKIR